MKVTNNYNQVVIESEITAEDMKNISRYNAKALNLYDSKGKLTFGVLFGNAGSVKDNGIVFNQVTGDRKMFVAIDYPGLTQESEERRKAIIKDEFGMALANLQKVEAQIKAALDDVKATVETIDAAIACV